MFVNELNSVLRQVAFKLRHPSSKPTLRLVELTIFACLLPLLGLLVFDSDPTGIKSGFPWVSAGALLFAARYGSVWGVACAIVTGLFINLPIYSYEVAGSVHVVLALGTLIMSIIVGDAASAWRNRCRRSEAENQYLRHRLKEFSTDYHVLRVSHGQLEEYLAGQRLSLREALKRLKPVLSSQNDGIQAGSELMAVFSQFCSIQVAGLYAMANANQIDSSPVATHGDMVDLPLQNPILRTAIEERELVSIKLEAMDDNQSDSQLLAVVPLVDTDGHLHGVLAIKDMHFMAFQQHNLNVLALLGSYVGDMLTRSKGAELNRHAWFISELKSALRFARVHSTESILLSISFNSEKQAQRVAQFIIRSIRNLDASLLYGSERGAQLCLLLPLMGEKQGQAFLKRMNKAVAGKFQQPLNTVVVGLEMKALHGSDTVAECLEFYGLGQNVDILEEKEGDVSHGSDVDGYQSNAA